MSKNKFEEFSIEETMKKFKTTEDGLTNEEVENRRDEWGYNSIEEHHVNPVLKFFSYFWGPIPWMIEIAATLSAITFDWADFIIVVILLFFNAIIGFWQEYKADSAIEMLKEKLEIKAHVLRNKNWISIPSRDLVPGDIVNIKLGEIIPADLKIISGKNIELDQSALTGESLPVHKEINDLALMSSIIRRGYAKAVVVGTGMGTYFGETAKLIQKAKPQSHYQKSIMKIGRFLIILSLSLVALIMITALFRRTSFIDTLQFCLILTVAAIPVALPAVLSVTMAVGAIQLAKRQAIVSRLASIEEMASMNILCSDKTGTLTKNKMKLGDSKLIADIKEKDLILYAALCSKIEDEDPIELAIFEGLNGNKSNLSKWIMRDFLPFDPIIKRTEATVSKENIEFKVSKGAPQAIIQLCNTEEAIKEKIYEFVDSVGKRGYRTIGVAKTDNDKNWKFQGILSLYDPPRDDSAKTIKAAKKMGVQIKMITGDHKAIAREIGAQLNIGSRIYSADEIFAEGKEKPLINLENVDGFAQVYPEHKYRIVETYQKEGNYVGMTGDGVNDAPALKRADVGIAVSGATDAARSAADLVLTSEGLSVIVDGIKESRRIFRRMTSYAVYRIAETIRILLFMTFSILIFDFYPVTTVMIIILALLNDGPIMMIAYDNTILPEEPVRWNMYKVLIISSILGIMGLIASFTLFWIGEVLLSLNRTIIQTLIFLKLTVAGHMTIYLTRSDEHHFWKRPLPASRLFITSEATQVVATLFAVYGIAMAPIGWLLAGLVWGYALIWFLINNLVKVYLYRYIDKRIYHTWDKHIEKQLKSIHPFPQ
ncbi:MAG: plasma-membrane proton-efflux P-type ATPase [Candidatus Lokiarchaeota archaeon]|nr:plasma-membrane proton-efflux P-type ATPase [Candidatus Lokiarchaeota archaeon]